VATTDDIIERALGWGGIASRATRIDLGPNETGWFAYAVRSHGIQNGSRTPSFKKFEPVFYPSGYGCHVDMQSAKVCAIAECVERISAALWDSEEVVESIANDLGDRALDLASLPICSDEEYRSPYCDLQRPRKDLPLRWIKGRLLGRNQEAWVPLVLSHLYSGRRLTGEHIAHSISTGLAAHISLEAASLNAILEVVERDALALTWMLQRVAPKVALDNLDPVTQEFLTLQENVLPDVAFDIFDITSDLNIPVLLCLQTLHNRPFAYSLVSCSSAITYRDALQKIFRDAAMSRFGNIAPKTYPAYIDEFQDLHSSAAFMADIARKDAFDFLRSSRSYVKWCELEERDERLPKRTLASVVTQLEANQHDIFLVNLTNAESLDLGLNVVRAILPSLQPISFHFSARYLAHSRLRNFNGGCDRHPDSTLGINPFPLPFA
jgi:ribosomal protein S12 methylthiotransferase accessory factor